MTVTRLVDKLRAQGVTLSHADGQLHYRCPRGVLTESDRAALRQHKAELLAILGTESTTTVEAVSTPHRAAVDLSSQTPATRSEEVPRVGDLVYLLDTNRRALNLEPWRIDAIVGSDDGPLAVFIGRPYASCLVAYCRRGRGAG